MPARLRRDRRHATPSPEVLTMPPVSAPNKRSANPAFRDLARNRLRIIMNRRAVAFALLSAALFGVSTPAAKALLGAIDPAILAGLLYCGAGIGIAVLRRLLRPLMGDAVGAGSARRSDVPWLAGAIAAGGIVGPILLMIGSVAHRRGCGLAAAHARGCRNRPVGMVRLSREFRSAHRARHGLSRCRRACTGVVGYAVAIRYCWSLGDRRRLPCLGAGQQPDPQGLARRSASDRRTEGADRRTDQSAHRIISRRRAARLVRHARRRHRRLSWLWRKPRLVRIGFARPRHRAHRRLFLDRAVSSAPLRRSCFCTNRSPFNCWWRAASWLSASGCI